MKKRVLSIFLITFLILSVFLISAKENSTNTSSQTTITSQSQTDTSGVDKAYDCLTTKVEKNCDKLSLEEKIFSVLAIDKCTDELIAQKDANECWPKGNCNVKQTAQSILALNERGNDYGKAPEWIFSQNATPTDVVWYLQIDSQKETSCTVSYSGADYPINIRADKTISSAAGNCLALSDGNYWLRISPACYDKEFDVKCDEGFLTTLLYKKKTSPTIYVSEKATSASAEATTTESVNSKCFKKAGACDYEGTLWATLVLDYLDYDISSYLPYLVTMADENKEFLPEAFLYQITDYDDFRNNLLLMQQKNQYWQLSGDKFYDTAIALLPFQKQTPTEKQGATDWLMETQDKDGCFNNENTRDTAFLLYSIWPREITNSGGDDRLSCEDSNYYCMSKASCDGDLLSEYSCAGVYQCCSKAPSTTTCDSVGGSICNSLQECVGGTLATDVSGLSSGQSCCVLGKCETKTPVVTATCEPSGGTCKPSGCEEGETESFSDNCKIESDYCCIPSSSPTPTPGPSYLWLWIILILLIILVVIAIIFRDKLKPYWYKFTSKFSKKGGPSNGPSGPTSPSTRQGTPPRRPIYRQPSQRIQRPTPPIKRPITPAPRQKPRGELNDVLGKLKKMSE